MQYTVRYTHTVIELPNPVKQTHVVRPSPNAGGVKRERAETATHNMAAVATDLSPVDEGRVERVQLFADMAIDLAKVQP